MKNLLLIAISLLLFIGCSVRKKMDSWLGQSKHDVIMSWGPPESTAPDGNGGEIITYSQRVANQYADYTMKANFYINGSGVVYHWTYNQVPNAPTRVIIQ